MQNFITGTVSLSRRKEGVFHHPASVNPLKMYEYLAIGKPVVTVPMDEVADYTHLLTIAEPSKFSKGIEKAYEADTEMQKKMRIESVSGRSWADIAERILGLLG